MEEQILAVDLSTEQTLEVNLPEQDNVAQIDVYWQDEVTLDLDLSLMYIVSGQREIQDYVDNKSKPEIDEYIELNAKPIVAKVVEQEAKPIIDEYFEETVKPSITEFAEEEMAGYAATATAQVALATEQAGIATAQAGLSEASALAAAATLTSVNNKAVEFDSTVNAAKSDIQSATSTSVTNINNTVSAEIIPNLEGYVSSATNQASIATSKANEAQASASAAKTSETNAKSYADSINPATLVNISSDQTITGNKTFTKPIIARMNTVEENTPPAQNQYIDWISPRDKNGANIGFFGITDYADGRRCSRIGHTRTKSDGSHVYPEISVGTDKNGTTYTSAPNPPSNSNGTAIATTSWVSNAGAVVKSKSLADNGYVKFSSGLIIQWGLALNGNLTTFPTPFTSATSWAITTGYCGSGATDKMWGLIHDRKNTSFDWVAADSSEQMYWIAIGY